VVKSAEPFTNDRVEFMQREKSLVAYSGEDEGRHIAHRPFDSGLPYTIIIGGEDSMRKRKGLTDEA